MNRSIELRFCTSARNVPGINLRLPPAPSDHLQHPPDHLLHVATLDLHLDNFILPNVKRVLRLIPGTFLVDTQNLSLIVQFIKKLQNSCPCACCRQLWIHLPLFDYLVFQFEQDNNSECYQWHEWLYDESIHGHRPGQHSSDRSRGVDTGQVWIQSRLQSWGDTEEEGWNKLDGCVLVRYDCVIVMIYSKITVPRMLTFNLYQRISHISWVK